MSDAKRYDVTEKYIGTGEYVGAMEESATGDWVAFSDYAPLKARLEEAERERDRMRHGWQRECVETDGLLQLLGLCPSEYRSDGGSLLLGRIDHKLRRAKELAELRTRAEFLIGMIDARETRLAKATELLKETLDWPVPVSFSHDVRAFLDHTTAKEEPAAAKTAIERAARAADSADAAREVQFYAFHRTVSLAEAREMFPAEPATDNSEDGHAEWCASMNPDKWRTAPSTCDCRPSETATPDSAGEKP